LIDARTAQGEGAQAMSNPFDDLLTSTAEDGASVTHGVLTNRQDERMEVEELMGAWLEERHECIELGMFVDRARKLLCRMVAEGDLAAETKREARRLIRAMRAVRRAGQYH